MESGVEVVPSWTMRRHLEPGKSGVWNREVSFVLGGNVRGDARQRYRDERCPGMVQNRVTYSGQRMELKDLSYRARVCSVGLAMRREPVPTETPRWARSHRVVDHKVHLYWTPDRDDTRGTWRATKES